jgi:hypothetical protein
MCTGRQAGRQAARQAGFTNEKYALNDSKNSINLLSYYLLASMG